PGAEQLLVLTQQPLELSRITGDQGVFGRLPDGSRGGGHVVLQGWRSAIQCSARSPLEICQNSGRAGVAELADASDLKSEDSKRVVLVRLPPPELFASVNAVFRADSRPASKSG